MNDVRLKWLPVIDHHICNGCNRCLDVCEPKGLAMVDGVAVLTDATLCASDGHCSAQCPQGAIHMAWVPFQGEFGRGKCLWMRDL